MSLNLLKSTLDRGGEHIGDLIFWALVDARIDRAKFEGVWSSAGLPTGLLPEQPTAEKALKTAIRERQAGLGDRLLRLAKSDDAELVFGVVHEYREGDGDLTYRQEAKIVLDRKSESLATDMPGHEVVLAVEAAYRELRHTH